MSETMIYIAAASVFAVAAGVMVVVGGMSTPRQSARTVLHAGVCLIAAGAYLLMALGYGETTDASGQPLNLLRYADLLLTMPLLLLGLALTATPAGRPAIGLILALLFTSVAMVLTGGVSALTEGATEWIWFTVSLILLLGVLAILWMPFLEFAKSGHPVREETYVRHAALLSALWLLYPLVFVLGPQGAGAVSPFATIVAFAFLDFASKAAYGLLVVLEDDRLMRAEAAERAWPPAKDQLQSAMGRAHPGPALDDDPSPRRTARDRLLMIHYAQAAAREASMARLREGMLRAQAAGNAMRMRHAKPAAAPLPPPPEPRRPKPRPAPKPLLGALKPSDAVPIAMVAAALLVATWPRDKS